MPRPFSNYPYTDFHETNLDYILRLCRENLGIELKVIGNKLHLVNDLGESLSQVTISYAEKALQSNSGNELDLFILSAGVSGDKLAFTDGKGQTTTITVPYAVEASSDVNGELITSYIKNVQAHNDYLRITKGDGTYYELTVPFATKAEKSASGKDIDTFVATISTSGNDIVVKDNLNNEIARFEVQYAETANRDTDDDLIVSTYANSLVAGTSTVKLIAKDGSLLSEITVPFATAASTDNNGTAFRSGYGNVITTGTSTIKLIAPDGTQLSEITVPFATTSTHATNAIESVTISGNNLIFTTYGGQSYSITCPYAVSALKDGLQNEISKTYIANVTNDSNTGKITFLDAEGQEIVSLIPTVDKATHDSYNNLIADFVKQISVSSNSDYVTVVHGTGTSESLQINYSNKAWKDTGNHVIKNFYVADLECVEDVNDGHYKLVAYDGDTPKAELFRIDIIAYSAQTDINGVDLTSYVKNVSAKPLQSGGQLEITLGDGTTNSFVVPKSLESNYAGTAASATVATTAHKDVNGHDLTDFVYSASPYSKHGIELFDGNGNSKYQYDPIPDDSAATSGDVLSTDANGNLSWVPQGGGGSGLPADPSDNSFQYYLMDQDYGSSWGQDWRPISKSKYFRFNTGYVQDPDDDGYWQLMSANTVYDFEAGVRTPFAVVLPCESTSRDQYGVFYELPYRGCMFNGNFIDTKSPCVLPVQNYEIGLPTVTAPTFLTKAQLRSSGIFDLLCRKEGIASHKVNLLPQWYTPNINSEDTTKLVESTVFIGCGSGNTKYYVIAGFLTSDTKINTGLGLIPAGLAYFYEHTYDTEQMLYDHSGSN